MTFKITFFIYLISFCTNGFSATNKDEPVIKAITLAPHLTELVYSAGGDQNLRGVSAYSDFPDDAKQKPIIGDAFHLNLELIKQIDPDIIFYWENSTPQQTIKQLISMQFNLVGIEINTLNDIPKAIDQIAQTLNTKTTTDLKSFSHRLAELKSKPKIIQTALIQISDQPIYTVNGNHWMSEAINICGLKNVFDDLKLESAAVTLESVILKAPEVIIRIADFDENNQLNKWQNIPAIANNHIITLNADHFTRPTLRTLLAIESLCEQVNEFNHPN